MKEFVIDNSVVLSWLIQEEHSKKSLAILKSLKSGKAHVPSLWPYELINALHVAEKRKRIKESQAAKFLNIISNLPFFVEETSFHVISENVLQLSRKYKMTAYDASYIELALRNSLPIVSFDQEILSVCRKIGIKCL